MTISTIKRVWSEGFHDSSEMKWLLISAELSHKNIRLMTELESFVLLAYQVGTWLTEM